MAFKGALRSGVSWSGLDSLQQELAVLAADLVAEANAILTDSAQAAKTAIAAAYPEKTGALRRGLVLRSARGLYLSGWTLLQTAPHGHLYEYGTTTRYNRAGAFRGVMPANPTFVPIAAAYRRTAISQIIYRLQWHGATRVTGDADQAA